MHEIFHVFDTTGKREIISRFCDASRNKFFSDRKMPKRYSDGIRHMSDAILPSTHISKNDIIEALRSFTFSERESDIYGKIFSKIGKVICFYLLGNISAMKTEVESVTLTPVPKKIHLKGALQQTGRAAAVVGGIVLFPVFHPAAILTYAGMKIPVEDTIIQNPEIKSIINTFQKIDFTPFYERNNVTH